MGLSLPILIDYLFSTFISIILFDSSFCKEKYSFTCCSAVSRGRVERRIQTMARNRMEGRVGKER